MVLFLKLLLAHLVGEFLLQPADWLISKQEQKLRDLRLYIHSLIHGLLVVLFVGPHFVLWAAVLALCHFAVDAAKVMLQGRGNRGWIFFMDQLAHLLCLISVVWLNKNEVLSERQSFLSNHLAFITAAVFLTVPVSIVIRLLMVRWVPSRNEYDSLKDAGRHIGILERLFVFWFVVTGYWPAVAFLFAAKFIYHFGELRSYSGRKMTEHLFIGTLLSFGIAIGTGICYNKRGEIIAANTIKQDKTPAGPDIKGPRCIVLGVMQDGGMPHAGCTKTCCAGAFAEPAKRKRVVCLGISDPGNHKTWLIEATPDIVGQMKQLSEKAGFPDPKLPDGILLTHAHMGHYSGLMHLGREALNSREVPVYALPRMSSFLQDNGPWQLLIVLKNIQLHELRAEKIYTLSPAIKIKAFIVPHRDEYSETAGFVIEGPSKKILFIPDIDKWSKWRLDLQKQLAGADYAFIDGTFYNAAEVGNRNISEIPHPLVPETMELLKGLPEAERKKVHFIHFNHTNPLLIENSEAAAQVLMGGFRLAHEGQVFPL